MLKEYEEVGSDQKHNLYVRTSRNTIDVQKLAGNWTSQLAEEVKNNRLLMVAIVMM